MKNSNEKHIIKSFLSLTIAFIMLLALLPTGIISYAGTPTSGKCGKNVSFKYSSGGVLTISGQGPMYDYTTNGSRPWTAADIKSVVINAGVTSIGSWAFQKCSNLTSVTIGSSVLRIGNSAFYLCGSLTEVDIPDNVNRVEECAFSYCDKLRYITLGSGITYISSDSFVGTAFQGDSDSGVKYLGDWLIRWRAKNSNGYYLSSYTVKSGTVGIAAGAFSGMSDLTSINLGGSVKYICDNAFRYCYKLGHVGDAKSIKSIGDGAFYSCRELNALFLLYGVEFIGKNAFYDTGSLPVSVCKDSYAEVYMASNGVGHRLYSVEQIGLNTSPKKKQYIEGEALNISGGKVKLFFDAGSIPYHESYEIIEMTEEMVSGYDSTKIGAQTLTITVCGKTTTFNVEVVPKQLSRIKATTLPTKTSYLEGKENLDVAGGRVALYYDNGTSEVINMTSDMVSGFDITNVGVQTLTVTYEGFTDTFEVEVVAKTLSDIAVTTLPTKTTYLEGNENLDIAGGKITLYYDNDTSEVIDMTADMVSGFDNTKVGLQAVEVTYLGKSAAFNITIVAKTLTGVEVTALPTKTAYLEAKDELNVSGGKVTLYYNNNTSEAIDITPGMVSGFDNTKVGAQMLTVSYEGFTDTFEVEIIAKSLSSIRVSNLPNKTSYLEGKENLDVTGGRVALYYDNGTSEVVDMTPNMVSGFDNTKVGPQALTVTYNGRIAAFNVAIVAKTLTSIAVTALPAKVSYLEGENAIDVTGGKVTLYYNNDTYEVIDMTASMVSGLDSTKVGSQTLTATYQGKTATFNVEIIAKSLTSIAVTVLPNKTSYLEGKENLDVSGGVLTLYYDNGLMREAHMIFANGYKVLFTDTGALETIEVSGFDNSKPGECLLSVVYGGFSTSFGVTITEKQVSGISVISAPDKAVYEIGDSLDINGCRISVSYNNGSVRTAYMLSVVGTYRIVFEDASVSDIVTISGFDSDRGGEKTIKVEYKGFADTFIVTVNVAVIIGDIDGDEEVTVADALAALRASVGLSGLLGDALEAADIDGDGEITVSDALRILRIAAKLTDSL